MTIRNGVEGARGVGHGVAPGAHRSSQGRGGFAAALENAGREGAGAVEGPAREMLEDAARSIDRGQRMVESVIRSARNGRVFSQEELIAIQAGVYRYTQELELASKLVEKATGAVKTTLQSQQ
jgi:hypothetical protein